MSSVILEAHDLTKEYRHTVALDHIDLKIEKGKIYGFIGQNGAGKTTFLRLVTQYYKLPACRRESDRTGGLPV